MLGNVFVNPDASSSAPSPQELNPWSSSTEEPLHGDHKIKIRVASPDRQPEIQSSLVEGGFSENYGADQQQLQISDPLFDKFPTPTTFASWKIKFKTEICTCSQIPYGSHAVDQRSGDG